MLKAAKLRTQRSGPQLKRRSKGTQTKKSGSSFWAAGFWAEQTLLRRRGASGDTELFEKARNINGFQGGRVANNLYISPFWATVFQTAAFFLYPNSSVVIRVRKPLFFPLWPPQAGGHGCFPMDHIREANRRLFSSKSTLFIFIGLSKTQVLQNRVTIYSVQTSWIALFVV